jgi:hypothetical protein
LKDSAGMRLTAPLLACKCGFRPSREAPASRH